MIYLMYQLKLYPITHALVIQTIHDEGSILQVMEVKSAINNYRVTVS